MSRGTALHYSLFFTAVAVVMVGALLIRLVAEPLGMGRWLVFAATVPFIWLGLVVGEKLVWPGVRASLDEIEQEQALPNKSPDRPTPPS